jgi:hypothetical protein
VRMAAAALLPLLSGCAAAGGGPYLMVSDSADGTLVWRGFWTAAACDRARRASDIETRCALRGQLRDRHLID